MRYEKQSSVVVSEFGTVPALHSATWPLHCLVGHHRRILDNARRASESDRTRLETLVRQLPSRQTPTYYINSHVQPDYHSLRGLALGNYFVTIDNVLQKMSQAAYRRSWPVTCYLLRVTCHWSWRYCYLYGTVNWTDFKQISTRCK